MRIEQAIALTNENGELIAITPLNGVATTIRKIWLKANNDRLTSEVVSCELVAQCNSDENG